MKEKIRVRIAPSPTGKLHIGTVRTALFNYLFAKKEKGNFVMRIEDTDRSRSSQEYEKDIINGLKWLGLKWDEGPDKPGKFGPYRQTEREGNYQKYIDHLRREGLAYERNGALWFKIRNAKTKELGERLTFKDMIRGIISFNINLIEDFVIVKSDKTPLFLLTNVIDDYEMEISHIIRGEDHIPNTPKQILIGRSLDFPPLKYAHLPLILNPDRSKMSKRLGMSTLEDFRAQGYLPEALINFLVLLGWSPGDDREFFSLPELINEFDMANVGKSGSAFDLDKLNSFNSHYIRKMNPEKLAILINKGKFNPYKTKNKKQLLEIIEKTKDRIKKLSDFSQYISYFFERPQYGSNLLIFSGSDSKKCLIGLEFAYQNLEQASEKTWDSEEALNSILTHTVQNHNLKNGDVFWPVRVALSGADKSPSPAEILKILGPKESLIRLKKGIELLKNYN